MKCPVCTDVPLAIAERQGVEIDYCPTCRGVWLDRGELDKIIERSLTPAAPAAPPPTHGQPQQYEQQQYQQSYQQPHKRKRKESWLSELFD